MELLNRYLYQIEKYLPRKDQDDTIKELRNLLLEDLDSRIKNGEKEKDALYNLIKEFGSPKEVALKYRNDEAIISREMEPLLYMILKIIAVTIPAAILLSSTISFISSESSFSLIDTIINMFATIPSMINGLLGGIGFVFVAFVIIERYFKDAIKEELSDFKIPEFDPKHLPKIPANIYKVSLFESFISIAFSGIFLYLLNYEQGLIAVYVDGAKYPLLNDNFDKILPVINVNILLGVVISFSYIIKRSKSLTTSTLFYIHTIISAIILLLLATNDILNNVVIDGHNLSFLSNMTAIGLGIGATVTLIGGSYTYFKVLTTTKKQKYNIKQKNDID